MDAALTMRLGVSLVASDVAGESDTLVRPMSRNPKESDTLVRPISRSSGNHESGASGGASGNQFGGRAPPRPPAVKPTHSPPAVPEPPPRRKDSAASHPKPPAPAAPTQPPARPAQPEIRRQRTSSNSQNENEKAPPTQPAGSARQRPPKPPPPNPGRETRNSRNGILPTPKVHMGAGLSKIFNGCPLKINCATQWIHPETEDQYILFGCDEGLYFLNLELIHEEEMVRLLQRKITWLLITDNTLITLMGKKNPQERVKNIPLKSNLIFQI